MSLSSVLLAALLATSTPVPETCSPDPPASVQAGGEAYVRRAELDWAMSIARDEAAFLRRFTANNFVAVFDGEVISRAALIAGARGRRPGAATDELESVRVHLSGSTAIAEGSEIWSETASGHRRHIVWSDLWVHCGGAWRLVTAMSVGSPAR